MTDIADIRLPPSATSCPPGHHPAAALACRAGTTCGDLHRGAGPRIRPADHALPRHRQPVGAGQSRASDRLQPDGAHGAGPCRRPARTQHRRACGTLVLHRRAAEPVLLPVPRARPDRGDRVAGAIHDRARPARGRLRLGARLFLPAAALGCRGAAGAAADLSARRLALDRARNRGDQPLCLPGHRGIAKIVGRTRCHRAGAGARAASDPARWARGRRCARTRHAAVDHRADLARAGNARPPATALRLPTSRPCASRRSAAAISWPRSPSCRRPARRSTT